MLSTVAPVPFNPLSLINLTMVSCTMDMTGLRLLDTMSTISWKVMLLAIVIIRSVISPSPPTYLKPRSDDRNSHMVLLSLNPQPMALMAYLPTP